MDQSGDHRPRVVSPGARPRESELSVEGSATARSGRLKEFRAGPDRMGQDAYNLPWAAIHHRSGFSGDRAFLSRPYLTDFPNV